MPRFQRLGQEKRPARALRAPGVSPSPLWHVSPLRGGVGVSRRIGKSVRDVNADVAVLGGASRSGGAPSFKLLSLMRAPLCDALAWAPGAAPESPAPSTLFVCVGQRRHGRERVGSVAHPCRPLAHSTPRRHHRGGSTAGCLPGIAGCIGSGSRAPLDHHPSRR